MFNCKYKNLTLSFNEFHNIEDKDLPQDGEFCLLELKDGSLTAGEWNPDDSDEDDGCVSGNFIRGNADTVSVDEVSKWHSLECYDLQDCLEDEETDLINIGAEKDGAYSVKITGFKSLNDSQCPKNEQYCFLLLTNGGLSGGRWDGDVFDHAPALCCFDPDEVWAWTALSSDRFFALEEKREKEIIHETELNMNPSADKDRFKYGLDISVYYEKALEKLLKEYPWATLTQMRKKLAWEIVPCHGRYVFGQCRGTYNGSKIVSEWKKDGTADEFIDFLVEYTKDSVKNSNISEKFRYGMNVDIYIEKAYENVKKDYRWLDKKIADKYCSYAIRQINEEWEFLKKYNGDKDYHICDFGTAEGFIESVEYDYQCAALEANPVVGEYAVSHGHVDLRGWNLEKYVFLKLQTGDYKVYIQAGNRVTGGGRDFFIPPYCFEADTYEEFLNRYLKIVPGESFGLFKTDLLENEELKNFLGY